MVKLIKNALGTRGTRGVYESEAWQLCARENEFLRRGSQRRYVFEVK